MDGGGTLGAVTVAIHKPQSQARAQSLVKAFPNLAGSDLPGALGAAPTPSLWFVWLPQFVLWGKRRRLWCKENTPGGWEGEPTGKTEWDVMEQGPAEPALCLCLFHHTSSISRSPFLCIPWSGGWKCLFSTWQRLLWSEGLLHCQNQR